MNKSQFSPQTIQELENEVMNYQQENEVEEEPIEITKPLSMIYIFAETNVELERVEMEHEDFLSQQYAKMLKQQEKQQKKDSIMPLFEAIMMTSEIIHTPV